MTKQRRDNPPQCSEPKSVCVPAGAPTWVTPELIQHTLRVWRPYYEHTLTTQDVLTMIQSTGRIAEALMEGNREPSSPEDGQGDLLRSWPDKW